MDSKIYDLSKTKAQEKFSIQLYPKENAGYSFGYCDGYREGQKRTAGEYMDEIENLRAKAEKWEKLTAAIHKCYFKADGSENTESDLGHIGEIAASMAGYL